MEDGGYIADVLDDEPRMHGKRRAISEDNYGSENSINDQSSYERRYEKLIYRSNNFVTSTELVNGIYNSHYRFGVLNDKQMVDTCREYIFFTKPQLNIYKQNNADGSVTSGQEKLHPGLKDYPYWQELSARYPGVIECLEGAYHNITNPLDPFNHLLSNMVQSNLDVPSLSSEMIDTPSNTYGVNYNYKGSSEASDDGFDFSLEFKDTKYLPVYHFFRAYEDYEKLKHHGVVAPARVYTDNCILHDQYAIYKFLVAEDNETIIYYAKYYGVKSKSLPRDVFSNTSFDNGLSYTIDFNAAFVEDMDPQILSDFNKLALPYFNTTDDCKYNMDAYNDSLDTADMRPARCACVVKEEDGGSPVVYRSKAGIQITDNKFTHTTAPGKYVYKLKWRGDAEV